MFGGNVGVPKTGKLARMSEALPKALETISEALGRAQVAAKMPIGYRRYRGPKPRQPFDKRTIIGRRAVALAATFRARLGAAAADPVVNAAIEKAAQLTALAEVAAARALRADPQISFDDVVRLTRLADLSVRRLQLDRKPDPPSLGDLLNG
jgi:hypothetical protein